MSVTTWGELTDEWIGRTVIVRWEDGTEIGPDSLSGLPHEWRGTIVNEAHGIRGDLWLEHAFAFTSGFPDHALVQEVA
jgi:hypothetical protein